MSLTLDQVIERIKARVAAVDPNGPRKVLGVFQLNIKTASGVEEWSKSNKYIQTYLVLTLFLVHISCGSQAAECCKRTG